MKGFVPTPDHVVDLMVRKLFRNKPPKANSRILDPGCGTGAFIAGIERWCREHRRAVPHIVGIDSDPRHTKVAGARFRHRPSVRILQSDFLKDSPTKYDYIIGNPPYVPITQLSQHEKDAYRERYVTASGRFDLYLLFFEQALGLLGRRGRLVFITPEKFLYVQTARPLRHLLGHLRVPEIHFLEETTFGDLVTYPTITTVVNDTKRVPTRVILRDGSTNKVSLPDNGSSWLSTISGREAVHSDDQQFTLADLCVRISCGVATGADAVYVTRTSQLDQSLQPYAYPTIAGRELSPGKALKSLYSMLLPYASSARLLNEPELGELGAYLRDPARLKQLMNRTCVTRKPWYAFHENPPLADILLPKILCKDIAARPFFIVDESGSILPRHSVYYIVPKDSSIIHVLASYLNSAEATSWLVANCQRAANGFIRLQSKVLQRMPIPSWLLGEP